METSKRQSSPRGILEIGEKERLWKLWYTNEYGGFQMRLISVLRSDGRLDLAIISEGPRGKQWGYENPTSDEDLTRMAEEWIKEIGDEHLRFRFLDLSGIEPFKNQIEALEREGLSVESVTGSTNRRRGR